MSDGKQNALAEELAGVNAEMERSVRAGDVPRLLSLMGNRRRVLETALGPAGPDAVEIAGLLTASADASRSCLRVLREGMEAVRERIESAVRGRGALSLLRGGSDGDAGGGRLVNGRG